MFSVTERVVGPAIRAAREARGVSLRALAADLEVSPATLSAIERGLTPLTVNRLAAIARLMGIQSTQLLSDSDPHLPRVGLRARPDVETLDWRRFDRIVTSPILEASIQLFVRQGFHATSLREIASEAGLSVAGVYHHYPSKEQILVDILDLTMNEISWRIEAATRQGRDPVQAFALMVESLALFHAVRGDLAFVGATEMRAFSPSERSRVTATRDAVQHALDRQARACYAEGDQPQDEDLRMTTRAIATMCTSLPSWFRTSGSLSAETVARQYAAYALALLPSPVGPACASLNCAGTGSQRANGELK